MDNQLSLFGFEEPISPESSKISSSKEKKGADSLDDKNENTSSIFAGQSNNVLLGEGDISAELIDASTLLQGDHIAAPTLENESIENRNESFEQKTLDISALTEPVGIEDNNDEPLEKTIFPLNELVVPNEEPLDASQILAAEMSSEKVEYESNNEESTIEVENENNGANYNNEEATTIGDTFIETSEATDSSHRIDDDDTVSSNIDYTVTKEESVEEEDSNTVARNVYISQPSISYSSNESIIPKTTKDEHPSENPTVSYANHFGKKGRKSFKEIDAEVDLIQVPPDELLFTKQYYPISQVAKWFRVNNSLLRFWENEFEILKPRKNRKGDRLFRPEDIKNLQVIYYLLRQKKYTIAGARKFIKNNRKTVDVNMKIIQTLNDFKRFLLELKVNSDH